MDAAIPIALEDHRERLEMAPEVSARLRRLGARLFFRVAHSSRVLVKTVSSSRTLVSDCLGERGLPARSCRQPAGNIACRRILSPTLAAWPRQAAETCRLAA